MIPIGNVDILTANYNNGKYLYPFFESIINSTIHPNQLIFVDDGSNDDSLEIAESFAKKWKFIKIIVLKHNVGFANALNEGIIYIKSKYTIRIDPDDYISSERIEKQLCYMISNPDVDILGSNIQYFDSDNMKKLFISNVPLSEKMIIRNFKNGSCGVIHGSTIIRSELLKKFNYDQNNVPAEDFEIFSKMIKNSAVIRNIPSVLTFVRIHINSVSNFLPYNTIKKSYDLVKEIWGINHFEIFIKFKYLHLKYYRLFLFEKKKIRKIIYIIISSLFAPNRVINRIISKKSIHY
jgi:glycosyltransferase involved in cell wall biosynthesis